VEAAKLRPDLPATNPAGPSIPWTDRLGRYFTEGPFRNRRFLFFIFMLLPVRTLFAHQWLTMPSYILRAYDPGVANHMEWLVNWINPMIIFLGVPITTALTRHINVYKMMVIGSFVSAVPTFLLCFGPNLSLLIANFVLYSIGEALWSARFLEYASELAPPGRIAQYMGLAQIPWLLAKGTTGFYSGFMLAKFCPADTPPAQLHTGTMWFIYGGIALVSPLGLWMARHWVMAGLQIKPANAATPGQPGGEATPA
jgi:MFS family permease